MPTLSTLTFYGSLLVITLLLLAFSRADYAGMIDKEGMQAWEVCALCHNANGISKMAKFPKLAGQKAIYIEQQIIAFREGRRLNDGGQMQSIVGEVAQEDVKKIAAYFSSLPPDTEFGNTGHKLGKSQAQKISLGRSIFNEGRDQISSCAGCHINKESNAPWLDGQHKQYLEKQLHDFNSGERESDCAVAKPEEGLRKNTLTRTSEHLEDAEIEALALYLSTLIWQRN
jgi:cytochrome c553